MNTFFEYEDIYGKVDTQYLHKTTREIFKLMSEIRHRLGKQGYLLDNYVCKLLEGMSAMDALAAMERAQRRVCEFNALVSSAMAGRSDEHPLFEKAKAYIDVHPLHYQEETTRHDIYSIALLDDFLQMEADCYQQELKQKLVNIFDNVDLRHLERDISRLAGGLYMERLNLFLCQRFLLVTPIAAFTQGLTDGLLSSLSHRDGETSRLVVSLWADAVGAENG